MIQLDILAVGDLQRDEDGNILKADSTSVLIRTPKHTIVVDPSTKYMRPFLKTSFKQIGVFVKDVDIVVVTHMHHDHIENLDMEIPHDMDAHLLGGIPQRNLKVRTLRRC